jgi:small-conductance mechanosensitive channel/CRP-like cAMP-binding protein
MKILAFTLAFLVSFAITRIPVGALERRLRRAPGSWHRYLEPLLVPLHLLLMATVIHLALSWVRWASNPSAYTMYAALAWLVLRAVTTLIFEWWFTDVRGVVLPTVLRKVVAFALGCVGALALLNVTFDVRLSDIVLISGAAALIAGLMFQGVMRDALLGVSMLVERRLVVSDWVRVDVHEGEVIAVDWKSTTLRTADGNEVVLPNRLVSDSAIVRRRERDARHRVRMEVVVPGAAPPNAVSDVLIASAAATSTVLRDPPPLARLLDADEHGARFEVFFWVSRAEAQAEAASAARSVLWYRLRRAGLVPQPSLSSPEETRAALASVPVLASVAPDQLDELARSVSTQRFGRGEVLFRQGEQGDTLVIVLSGELEILADDRDGAQQHVARVSAGSFVGERALMTGEARSATAIASVDTVAIVIAKADMLALLQRDAELAARIADVMADRAEQQDARERASRGSARPATSSSLLEKIRAVFSL